MFLKNQAMEASLLPGAALCSVTRRNYSTACVCSALQLEQPNSGIEYNDVQMSRKEEDKEKEECHGS